MTNLQVRRLGFEFADVPFLWQPANPTFSVKMNALSFAAIGFEKYVVSVVREALSYIREPGLTDEANAFLRQEAQHSSSHRRHVQALSRSYPGLADTLDRTIACYDDLLAERPLKYHLAHIANLESMFAPTFKMLLDHEQYLFRPGDERVASLFLWHFVEEIEHRSSALLIYRGLVRSAAYRLLVVPSMFQHVYRVHSVIADGFNAHVPFEQRKLDARVILMGHESLGPDPFSCVPLKQKNIARWNILLSLMPNHDPRNQPLPRFADRWFERYARGEDVVRWYSSMDAIAKAKA